ncbi:MAG: hypothetical protein AAF514_19880, partial [Verrucomicrobiota bacterium]
NTGDTLTSGTSGVFQIEVAADGEEARCLGTGPVKGRFTKDGHLMVNESDRLWLTVIRTKAAKASKD